MEKIKELINTFEWAWQTKPRLFALGIIFGASIMYYVNVKKHELHDYNIQKLREENEKLKIEIKESQRDCLEKIKEVKEFLKYIAE